MSEYVRPEIAAPVFHDADGVVIPYGQRWGMDGPPDHTYSVTSNLERFAPLHTIADALIAWLVDTYDVVVDQSAEGAADLVHVPRNLVRAVKLIPSDDVAAPLTIAFTSFPGLYVHAGVLFEAPLPPCGCDACDENWEQGADELERIAHAVVSGHFSERITGRIRPKVHYSLGSGGRGGWGIPPGSLTREGLKAARKTLRSVGAWKPWPLREPTPKP